MSFTVQKNDEYFTLEQLSRIFGITKQGIINLIKRNSVVVVNVPYSKKHDRRIVGWSEIRSFAPDGRGDINSVRLSEGKYLTLREVATKLNVSREWAGSLVRRSGIKYFELEYTSKVESIFIKESDLEILRNNMSDRKKSK